MPPEIFIPIGESSVGAAKHGDNDRRFQVIYSF